MRFLIVLVLGVLSGMLLAAGLLYFNPLSTEAMSPLSVSQREQINLNYSAVAADAIIYTNNGDSLVEPQPKKISELWEEPIRQSEALVTELYDARGNPVGFGIKFSSRSENTRLLNGEALVNSVWHVVLPTQGTLLVEQTENYWSYLRDIVVPAHMSAGDNWKGNWLGIMSVGPSALGMAAVYGGSGEFHGIDAEAIERVSAKAYSADLGPVAVDGTLVIELPDQSTSAIADSDAQSQTTATTESP